MSESSGKVTTHILDTANGCPAKHVKIDVFVQDGESWQLLGSTLTNDDGRTDAPVIGVGALARKVYKLEFHIGDYFESNSDENSVPFLSVVPIVFGVNDADAHYHVPLLASPFSYSTYRGS